MAVEVLDRQLLNRATLERQLLGSRGLDQQPG
jgi:hypothetical protein